MSHFRIITLTVLLMLLLLGGIWWYRGARHNVSTMHITLRGTKFTVEVADSFLAIERGLSGHVPLKEAQGMWFVFSNRAPRTFWMKEMKFPIDIIWVDGKQVIGVTKNIPAPDPKTPLGELVLYPSPGLVSHVLEVNAGTVDKFGIEVGDRIR